MYDAYAVNLTNAGVSSYTNHPFNNIIRLGNKYLYVSPTGVFEMGGDTDVLAPIEAHITTFHSKLGSANMKRVPYVYYSGRSGNGVTVGVTMDEGVTYNYASKWGKIHGSTNHRATIGKGVRGVYCALDVRNIDGGSLEIDSLGVSVATTSRGI